MQWSQLRLNTNVRTNLLIHMWNFQGFLRVTDLGTSGCFWKCSLAACRTDVSGSDNATSLSMGGHSGSVHWYLTN